MAHTLEQLRESARVLEARLGDFRPRCLLILGSGLGALADEVEGPVAVPYGEVPHMGVSTAPDHAGRFVFGRLAGQDVAVMQGRLHTYEGWSFADVSFPVRLLRLLGARTVIVTNAAGAVNRDFSAGDIMLITDHIKLFGPSPLQGPNLDALGPRFPDMSHVYTPALQDAARSAAAELAIPLREGVYMFFPAPSTRPRRRSGPPASWGRTPWACPRCRRPSRPPTAAWRCWASPCAPTWPPACWTGPCPRMRCSPPRRRRAPGSLPW